MKWIFFSCQVSIVSLWYIYCSFTIWPILIHCHFFFMGVCLIGFMGKGLTRQINRTWNYGVKGVMCSLLLLVFFPVICILCSAGGVCLAVTSPLWAPIFALFYHICFILFYDVDNPNSKHSPLLPMVHVVVRDLLIDGLLQPISCIFIALFICPVIALIVAVCKSHHLFDCVSQFMLLFVLFSSQLACCIGRLAAPEMLLSTTLLFVLEAAFRLPKVALSNGLLVPDWITNSITRLVFRSV